MTTRPNFWPKLKIRGDQWWWEGGGQEEGAEMVEGGGEGSCVESAAGGVASGDGEVTEGRSDDYGGKAGAEDLG